MKKLFDGVKHFSQKDFPKNKELFQELGSAQNPHTLFIGCSDSRVIPVLITKSLPGDLFVVRNIANVVPPYRISSEYLSTTSAIEYAVMVLKIDNIVVCGHSNCGGCRALFFDDKEMATIPHTHKWLELAINARAKAEVKFKSLPNPAEHCLERMVEQENVLEQMGHLLTFPFIKERCERGDLHILGWYYNIQEGAVYNYNAANDAFEQIE